MIESLKRDEDGFYHDHADGSKMPSNGFGYKCVAHISRGGGETRECERAPTRNGG